MTKIDPALYEAAQLDGAGPFREFVAITLPALRQEIGVCVTVTVIAALSAFDIVYISTQGGPGNATMVPGLEIYQLAFYNRQVGLASALARRADGPGDRLHPAGPMVLTRGERSNDHRPSELPSRAGVLLVVLMAVTLLPFVSMFTSALYPSGTYPLGISWPSHPHWGNFVQAFHVANMGAIFQSSVSIVIGVVPVSVLIATLAGFALGHLRYAVARSPSCCSCSA